MIILLTCYLGIESLFTHIVHASYSSLIENWGFVLEDLEIFNLTDNFERGVWMTFSMKLSKSAKTFDKIRCFSQSLFRSITVSSSTRLPEPVECLHKIRTAEGGNWFARRRKKKTENVCELIHSWKITILSQSWNPLRSLPRCSYRKSAYAWEYCLV